MPQSNLPQDEPPAEQNGQGELVYEKNDKHKLPWQPGRRGSLCPKNLPLGFAQKLLGEESVLYNGSRWAVSSGRAFKAQPHLNGKWHGWPVGWMEVPQSLRERWRKEKKLRNRDERRYWLAEYLPETI